MCCCGAIRWRKRWLRCKGRGRLRAALLSWLKLSLEGPYRAKYQIGIRPGVCGMNTEFLDLAAGRIFEILSLVVAIVALAYAILALRVAKQANQIAKESSLAAMRVRLRDEVSAAQISLLRLEEACQRTRNQWEQHWIQHIPVLGRPSGKFFSEPQETRHISEAERDGRAMFNLVRQSTTDPVSNDASELESHIILAQKTAIEIDQLSLRLEAPKSFGL